VRWIWAWAASAGYAAAEIRRANIGLIPSVSVYEQGRDWKHSGVGAGAGWGAGKNAAVVDPDLDLAGPAV